MTRPTPDLPAAPLPLIHLRAAILVLATTALAAAINTRDGIYNVPGMCWLTSALVLAIAGTLLPLSALRGLSTPRTLRVAVIICFMFYFGLALGEAPGGYTHFAPDAAIGGAPHQLSPDILFYRSVLGFAAVVCLTMMAPRPVFGRTALPILISCFVVLSVWLIRLDPNPFIDVFVFQQDSSRMLIDGYNPYALTFPDIYRGHDELYGPGILQNGRLLFGYPYMPLTLLITAPGLLGHDVRYAMAAAITLAAVLIALARPSLLSQFAAVAILFMPRTLYIIDQSWSEPVVILLLALTVYCALRRPRAAPYALGLLCASKQYMPFVLLLSPLLFGWDWRRLTGALIRAGITAAVVTLPLALWDIRAFLHSAVLLQLRQPFRMDALSFLSAWANAGHPQPPAAIAFVALAAAGGLALWRLRPGPANFAAAIALSYFAFFAFNKQAFANYYFLVIAALWCAVATMDAAMREPAPLDAHA